MGTASGRRLGTDPDRFHWSDRFYRSCRDRTTRTRFDVRAFNVTAGRRLGTDPDRCYWSDWLYRFYRFYRAGTTRTMPVPGRTCRIYWRYWTDARLRRRFQPGFPEAAFSVSGREIVGTRWRLGASPASRADGSHRARVRDTVPAGSTGSTGSTGRRLYWRYWLHW